MKVVSLRLRRGQAPFPTTIVIQGALEPKYCRRPYEELASDLSAETDAALIGAVQQEASALT